MTEMYDAQIERSRAVTSPMLPVDLAYLIASFPAVCQFPIRSMSPMTTALSLTTEEYYVGCTSIVPRDVSRPIL